MSDNAVVIFIMDNGKAPILADDVIKVIPQLELGP